ncbi:MAG: hypothetical protein M3R61_02945, partial [Chloroflexota bacterium]|nr:hypothetical protein [Chloroflexota bacterium]
MTNRRPILALIDGHALAFRAFHALAKAGLRASNGEATYAVFGFTSILLNMIHEHHPKYVAVAFDLSGPTFRDKMYAEYKAGRAETPSEFHSQLKRMKQLVTAFNIPIYTAEEYEADDVIGTLARQATAKDVDTIILTGDTDTLQLVDDHVRVLLANPYGQKTTTTLYDHEQVCERYKGLAPVQLADLRGLKGDTSDNIPGVKGIAEGGAITLLTQFGTVENLYEHLDDAPNRFKKALDGQRDIAAFSKDLATIRCDAPVTLDLRAAELRDYDRNAVIALFHELEFGASLVKRLPVTGGGVEAVELPSMTTDNRRPTTEAHSLAAVVSGRLSVVAPLALWAVLAAATVFALWPALWVSPLQAYVQLRVGVAIEGAQPHMLGNFFLGREDDAPGLLFYPAALALRSTPWTLLGLLLLPFVWWRNASASPQQSESQSTAASRRSLAALVGFVILFVAAMSVFPKKFDRYMVPAFPALDVLAAVGLLGIGNWGSGISDWGLAIGKKLRGEPSVACPERRRRVGRRSPVLSGIEGSVATGLVGLITIAALANIAWWHPYSIDAFNQIFGGTRAG